MGSPLLLAFYKVRAVTWESEIGTGEAVYGGSKSTLAQIEKRDEGVYGKEVMR